MNLKKNTTDASAAKNMPLKVPGPNEGADRLTEKKSTSVRGNILIILFLVFLSSFLFDAGQETAMFRYGSIITIILLMIHGSLYDFNQCDELWDEGSTLWFVHLGESDRVKLKDVKKALCYYSSGYRIVDLHLYVAPDVPLKKISFVVVDNSFEKAE